MRPRQIGESAAGAATVRHAEVEVDVEPLNGCVVITGMPGAGKTTVASLASRRVPRGSCVSGDVVNRMIGSGWVPFNGQPAEEAARQGALCNRQMCALARNFIDEGFACFMDTVVADRAELDELLWQLRPRSVRLVILAPGIEVCQDRNAGRDPSERWDFDGYPALQETMRQELADRAWWFDTSALTSDETVARLLEEVALQAPRL